MKPLGNLVQVFYRYDVHKICSVFCIIFKRVTDDEANKLFYFLQKISREWPLLNNITWEENGAIFTDLTYGGFVIIAAGLILGQTTGELNYARKTENFFLTLGALMFIAAGSLELAALDSVEERLVDNAAILGVISLITGMIFLVDLILASKRRKKAPLRVTRTPGTDGTTQTEDTKQMEIYRNDMNGNINGQKMNGYHPPELYKMDPKKPPTNGVKILPTSPIMDESYRIPVTNSNNEFVGTIGAQEVFTPTELKAPRAKIRSTESFLKSEKGETPVVRWEETDPRKVLVPPGYMLVPEDRPAYAQINPDDKKQRVGYVMIPIEGDKPRKLQSPTVTTTSRPPYYFNDQDRNTPSYSYSNPSISDPEEMSKNYSQRRKHSPVSDESGELPRYIPAEQRSADKWSYLPVGASTKAYDDDEVDFVTPFKRNTSARSSRLGQGEKPKSILRFDQFRGSKKEPDLNFPKEVNYNSLDSQKIAEDLKQLKEITKSDLDLSRDLERENELLKAHLRKEKEEKEKLKQNFQLELQNKEDEARSIIRKTADELEDRKKLEARITELEDLKTQLKIRDVEERKKLEAKIQDLEDEKDRRMSERDEQYFGIADLRHSQKESSPVSTKSEAEQYSRKEGAKEVNVKLKEKVLEMQDQAREEEELRKVIDDGFYFLDDEERKRKAKKPELSSKPKFIEKKTAPDLTNIYQKSIEAFRNRKPEGKTVKKWGSSDTPSPGQRSDDSDETPYSQITEEGATSYKSEAQFWLGGEDGRSGSTPTSPRDPGYVLHTAQNWPESAPTTPTDRFNFSSKKAQEPSRVLAFVDFDEPSKSPHTSQLLEHEEMPYTPTKVEGRRSGMLVRKVDFMEEPDTIIRPASVTGSTSTWKKWLQSKPKLHPTRSTPN